MSWECVNSDPLISDQTAWEIDVNPPDASDLIATFLNPGFKLQADHHQQFSYHWIVAKNYASTPLMPFNTHKVSFTFKVTDAEVYEIIVSPTPPVTTVPWGFVTAGLYGWIDFPEDTPFHVMDLNYNTYAFTRIGMGFVPFFIHARLWPGEVQPGLDWQWVIFWLGGEGIPSSLWLYCYLDPQSIGETKTTNITPEMFETLMEKVRPGMATRQPWLMPAQAINGEIVDIDLSVASVRFPGVYVESVDGRIKAEFYSAYYYKKKGVLWEPALSNEVQVQVT